MNPSQLPKPIEEMSDEELQAIVDKYEMEQDKSVARQEIPERELERTIAQQSTQVSQREPGQTESFYESIFSPKETAFESGLNEVIRDVVMPVAADVPQLIGQGVTEATSLFDPLAKKFGIPTSEELKQKGQEAGVVQKENAFSLENSTKIFDELTDFRFKDNKEEGMKKYSKELARDFFRLVNPAIPGNMSTLRAFGTALAGTVAPEILESMGVIDEGQKDYAKLGTWFLSSFVRGPTIRNAATDFYNRAESAISGHIITDNVYVNDIRTLRNNLREAGGESLRANQPALEFIDSVLTDVGSGTFRGEILSKQVRNLNQKIKEAGGINTDSGRQLMRIREPMQEVAERVGQNIPEFIQNFNEGNALWAGSHFQNSISRWATEHIDNFLYKDLTQGAKDILGIAKKGGKIVALPLIPIQRLANTTELIFRNEAALNYYIRYMTEAMRGNTKVAIEALKSFNEETKKENLD